MKSEKEYIIHFTGLKEGIYQFEYLIDSLFFSLIEDSLYKDGNIKVDLSLKKVMSELLLDFNISGTIKSICDYCLEPVNVSVNSQEKIHVKFGEKYDEPAEDIIILPHGEHELDISKIVYDLIVTSLPIRHVHQFDKNGKSECNPEMLKKLSEYSVEEPYNGDDSENQEDPRWNELRKLIVKK